MKLSMKANRSERTRIRMLCEGALLVAAAQILSYVKFLELSQRRFVDSGDVPGAALRGALGLEGWAFGRIRAGCAAIHV